MKKLVLFSTLFFLSRLAFLNPQPVFFDSPEYLSRLANPNFLQALASGHPPFHAGYILLFWPIYKLAKLGQLNPTAIVQLSTILLGWLAIFTFYFLVKNLFSQKIAFWSAIIVSIVPYFWITNLSIMLETPYIFFFILSLYFFVLYLKKGKRLYLLFSAFCFGFSYFIHTIVIVWLPAFISCHLLARVSILDRKNQRSRIGGENPNFPVVISSFLVSTFFFYLCNVFLLYFSKLFTLKNALFFAAFGKLNEHLSIFPLKLLIPRLLRNWLILLLRANTNLVVILSFISLFLFFERRGKRLFFSLGLWILPSIITNQWWDSVLLGRHGILASFPLAIATAYLVYNVIPTKTGIYKNDTVIPKLFRDLYKLLYRFLTKPGMTRCTKSVIFTPIILYLSMVSLGALWLLYQPIPYIQQTKVVSQLPQNGLLLESHFARPWITYQGEVIFVNEPGWEEEKLPAFINQTIQEEKPVFATSQALSDPYGLYSGPYLNPLSLNPQGRPELEKIFDQYHFEKILIVDEKKNLFIWQIKEKTTPQYFYHDFKIPYLGRERIDFFDPLSQLWFLVAY